jgi:iron complex outermembrane receptor protein
MRLLFMVWCFGAFAQTDIEVPTVNIYGAPKSSTLDSVPTVSEMSGPRLRRKRQTTLGETLGREAGVTSTQFGPNASRPVIRGQDGDRVRVLQNGVGVLDASSASQDHAVAVEPLVVDRIEVVRGPGALLYGSSAVGGVVNVTSSRIPEKIPDGFSGKAEGRVGSNDLSRGGGVALKVPVAGRFAVHADGATRASEDYKAGHDERIHNSYSRSGTEALGASYIGERGFVGASFSNMESSYGTVAEEFVHINLRQQRTDAAGEIKDWGGLRSLRASFAASDYKHDEIDEGSLATTFKNQGYEGRLEFRHPTFLGYTGLFGLQAAKSDFSAKGEESFLPGNRNENNAVFIFEEKEEGRLRPSFGVRIEEATVETEDDANFGPSQERSFDNRSGALGFIFDITSHYSLVLNGSLTERAPNYQELFALGNHAATGIHETGDKDLGKEQSQAVELSVRHKGALGSGSAGVFLQDYEDYIMLAPTGLPGPAPDLLPAYAYSATDARFYGAELDYKHNISFLVPSGILEFELRLDYLRGKNRRTGDNLPRVTPLRETIALNYRTDKYQTDLEIQRAERQYDLAPNEPGTSDHTLVNLGVERSFNWEKTTLNLFGRVNNVFDVEARNHVSLLKDSAPLMGRTFIAGLQASF